MQRWNWLLAIALAGATAPLSSASAYANEKNEKNEKTEKNEKVVKLEEIPAPAREGLLREAAGLPILKVEQETEKGKMVYEAHVKKGDDVLSISVDPNGKLISKHPEKYEK